MTRRAFLQSAAIATFLVSARLSGQQSARVRTLAGNGTIGESLPNNPYGIVVGPDGALYFCEVDTGRIRRLDPDTAALTTIAGNGQKGHLGDGGPAPAASLTTPHEIRFDKAGNLFVVERDTHVVRRIDARTKVITTVAGTGTAGFSGDGGPGKNAQLRMPHSIAFDADGRLLICDIGNSRIRSVDPATGTISTFAGSGERGATPDEGSSASTPLNGPRSLDVDPDGNIYLVLREGNAVFKIDRKDRRLARIAGTGATGFAGDNGPALQATFNGPKGIGWAPDQSLYIVDTENHAIRRLDLARRIVTTVLGNGQRGDGPDGAPLACRLARPHGIFVHRERVYVSDSENHRIRILE